MAGQPVAVAHQTIVVNDQTYGPLPKVMMCPYCQAQITTKVEYVSGGLTWLAAGLLCLFGYDVILLSVVAYIIITKHILTPLSLFIPNQLL